MGEWGTGAGAGDGWTESGVGKNDKEEKKKPNSSTHHRLFRAPRACTLPHPTHFHSLTLPTMSLAPRLALAASGSFALAGLVAQQRGEAGTGAGARSPALALAASLLWPARTAACQPAIVTRLQGSVDAWIPDGIVSRTGEKRGEGRGERGERERGGGAANARKADSPSTGASHHHSTPPLSPLPSPRPSRPSWRPGPGPWPA